MNDFKSAVKNIILIPAKASLSRPYDVSLPIKKETH